MESGAKGCEVIVSGKLRAQRAKAMKFKDGYMIAAGHPAEDYIDGCVRHVMLRQGVLGIKVGCGGIICCLGCQSGLRPIPLRLPEDAVSICCTTVCPGWAGWASRWAAAVLCRP